MAFSIAHWQKFYTKWMEQAIKLMIGFKAYIRSAQIKRCCTYLYKLLISTWKEKCFVHLSALFQSSSSSLHEGFYQGLRIFSGWSLALVENPPVNNSWHKAHFKSYWVLSLFVQIPFSFVLLSQLPYIVVTFSVTTETVHIISNKSIYTVLSNLVMIVILCRITESSKRYCYKAVITEIEWNS